MGNCVQPARAPQSSEECRETAGEDSDLKMKDVEQIINGLSKDVEQAIVGPYNCQRCVTLYQSITDWQSELVDRLNSPKASPEDLDQCVILSGVLHRSVRQLRLHNELQDPQGDALVATRAAVDAVMLDDVSGLKELISRGNIYLSGNSYQSETLLGLAASAGAYKVAEFLVGYHRERKEFRVINYNEPNFGTALHKAAVRGDIKMASILLKGGIDPKIRRKGGIDVLIRRLTTGRTTALEDAALAKKSDFYSFLKTAIERQQHSKMLRERMKARARHSVVCADVSEGVGEEKPVTLQAIARAPGL